MSRKKVSTTVYLDPDIFVRFKALADGSKVPVALFVRDAVERAIPKWERAFAEGVPLSFGVEADACAKCKPLVRRERSRRRRE